MWHFLNVLSNNFQVDSSSVNNNNKKKTFVSLKKNSQSIFKKYRKEAWIEHSNFRVPPYFLLHNLRKHFWLDKVKCGLFPIGFTHEKTPQNIFGHHSEENNYWNKITFFKKNCNLPFWVQMAEFHPITTKNSVSSKCVTVPSVPVF